MLEKFCEPFPGYYLLRSSTEVDGVLVSQSSLSSLSRNRPRPELDNSVHQKEPALRVRYALVVVLGYSRLLWLQFYPRQDLATLMLGLDAWCTA